MNMDFYQCSSVQHSSILFYFQIFAPSSLFKFLSRHSASPGDQSFFVFFYVMEQNKRHINVSLPSVYLLSVCWKWCDGDGSHEAVSSAVCKHNTHHALPVFPPSFSLSHFLFMLHDRSVWLGDCWDLLGKRVRID